MKINYYLACLLCLAHIAYAQNVTAHGGISNTIPSTISNTISNAPSNTALHEVVPRELANKIISGLGRGLSNIPPIDDIKFTPLTGIYEVRYGGTELFYSNADGSYIMQGNLIDTIHQKNLTQNRINSLSAIDFKSLDLKDAIRIGKGKRKIAIFEDPHCGYCKMFEKDIQNIPDTTFYIFLYPILGADSVKKSTDIWCSKESAQAWTDWMIKNNPPASDISCNASVLQRNIALGKKYRITGTPTLIFEDGTKIPGVMKATQIEEKLKTIKN